MHHKTAEILDKDDLEKLWNLLKENISPPNDMKERINYRFSVIILVLIKLLQISYHKNASIFLQQAYF